jgi:hypothetical protein
MQMDKIKSLTIVPRRLRLMVIPDGSQEPAGAFYVLAYREKLARETTRVNS